MDLMGNRVRTRQTENYDELLSRDNRTVRKTLRKGSTVLTQSRSHEGVLGDE